MLLKRLVPFSGSSSEEQWEWFPLISLENDEPEGKASYQETDGQSVKQRWLSASLHTALAKLIFLYFIIK